MTAVARHNVTMTGPADGPVMVFAHGYGSDQRMWRLVAPHFADRHRVVLFDHLGSGGSDSSAYDAEHHASLRDYADDVLAILHELDLTDVVYVGHSNSAMIGALAAIAEPERFGKLVMLGPSPRYVDDGDYRGGFRPEDIEGLLDALESNYLGWSGAIAPVMMDNPERPELAGELESAMCTVDPDIALNFARVTFLADNRADLPDVPTPTLVVSTAQDAISPLVVGEYVRDHLPDARLVQLDARGHCPHLSAPEQTTAAIADFVDA